jgi:hypothetical protein
MRLALSLLLVLTLFLAPTTFAKQPVEGTSWKVKVTPDDDARNSGQRPYSDTLIFKGGMFESVACRAHGIKPVQYEENPRPGGIATFKANPESQTEGKAEWTGRIVVTQIEGEMTWTKKDGAVLHYSFKGEKE